MDNHILNDKARELVNLVYDTIEWRGDKAKLKCDEFVSYCNKLKSKSNRSLQIAYQYLKGNNAPMFKRRDGTSVVVRDALGYRSVSNCVILLESYLNDEITDAPCDPKQLEDALKKFGTSTKTRSRYEQPQVEAMEKEEADARRELADLVFACNGTSGKKGKAAFLRVCQFCDSEMLKSKVMANVYSKMKVGGEDIQSLLKNFYSKKSVDYIGLMVDYNRDYGNRNVDISIQKTRMKNIEAFRFLVETHADEEQAKINEDETKALLERNEDERNEAIKQNGPRHLLYESMHQTDTNKTTGGDVEQFQAQLNALVGVALTYKNMHDQANNSTNVKSFERIIDIANAYNQVGNSKQSKARLAALFQSIDDALLEFYD